MLCSDRKTEFSLKELSAKRTRRPTRDGVTAIADLASEHVRTVRSCESWQEYHVCHTSELQLERKPTTFQLVFPAVGCRCGATKL